MTAQTATTEVTTDIEVEAPIAHVFDVFTNQIGSWWDKDHHILEAPLAEMVFEPRAGGRIIDRGTDGSESCWARVLAYEPPTRVVFSWDINTAWKIETDPEKTSEVEVRFIAEEADRTRVELEHRNLDRHGDGWEAVREGVDSEGGWPLYSRFADVARG